MSELLVNTIKKADGTGGLTVPTGTGTVATLGGGTYTGAIAMGANNISFSNGNGIDFSASEGANAQSSVLDDYEQGAHTVSITFGTSGSATLYANQDSLNYIKIGQMVHVNGRIRIETTSSPVGTVKLSLPFNVAGYADQNYSFGSVAMFNVNAPTSTYNAVAEADVNTSTFQILFPRDNDTWLRLDAADISDADYIGVTMTYVTDA